MIVRQCIAALLLCAGSAVSAEMVAEPDSYRMDAYRSPVPATLNGGTVIGPEAAYALWQSDAAGFIDVLPQAPRPENLPEGTIWRDKPRVSIPGAIWLPNVGYGAIADVTAAYFRRGLDKATGGDPTRPIVIFCLEDCWMSWNAAKRAVEWGYSDVYWMPEGTDGWKLWGYPLARILPERPQP
ncbi:PQQ-dependent catabolism-associated CXXCW motif protein [Rhodovulum imhoffii]|uniref:PQQ-dependent catabolism-associated CXXCW motif protein n=1 Tax=Rhodovulum imhoffii TaxID=365340 RepID=A0A2T5BWP5_9RHOB|nr:PQQ-dependent catabolism-associated CXXCW motif protein [Rhodovulum imhoffii]MBK5933306.1 rhodanese [Rhodovulum imhoffii]PTN04064.1 PQQ-dependent catabolism-associated CXXCW motif protein [Rhodovulum imhoffii]